MFVDPYLRWVFIILLLCTLLIVATLCLGASPAAVWEAEVTNTTLLWTAGPYTWTLTGDSTGTAWLRCWRVRVRSQQYVPYPLPEGSVRPLVVTITEPESLLVSYPFLRTGMQGWTWPPLPMKITPQMRGKNP